ncbi:flagellar motor switch protein FliN [Paracidovorax anthurii]|uniref:Flagellar motor switch protein FliN n=1 Tax=Paracidovorax anthurii TaxID=78229 RepID=A0A328Z3M2_9BURK|nr:flagellar motor switch protein FliN [Paracidovorax anthurii]RAR76856.1 flagellar motor switch protein FliN/FliY [Paracidovorax anthurii]WCM93799.1 flagellar motor switch protein FliN [Acidovorax sp. NCPPB 2350]
MTSPTDGADDLHALLNDAPAEAPAPARRPARDLPQMMRKIPVTVTLEVGAARVSLHDLLQLGHESVIELDTLAGEPLTIKVNGTAIGRAEVVVSGENYGLKVVELTDIDLDGLA